MVHCKYILKLKLKLKLFMVLQDNEKLFCHGVTMVTALSNVADMSVLSVIGAHHTFRVLYSVSECFEYF